MRTPNVIPLCRNNVDFQGKWLMHDILKPCVKGNNVRQCKERAPWGLPNGHEIICSALSKTKSRPSKVTSCHWSFFNNNNKNTLLYMSLLRTVAQASIFLEFWKKNHHHNKNVLFLYDLTFPYAVFVKCSVFESLFFLPKGKESKLKLQLIFSSKEN